MADRPDSQDADNSGPRAKAAGDLLTQVLASLEGEGDLTDADALELILAVGKRAKEETKDDKDDDKDKDDKSKPKSDDKAPPPCGGLPLPE